MRRSFALLASLAKWHHALTKVPDKSKVLPESVGQLFRAWQGDKLLGAATALAVQETTKIRDPGTATTLVSKALSNQFFAQHVPTLFPNEFFASLSLPNQALASYSDKQWGATLEAAVFEVHQSCEQSKEAIAELAEWLIENAQVSQIEMNPKGKLLSVGGTIESHRVGGPDHSPVHEAVAQWGSVRGVERRSGSKQQVEELAAKKVLQTLLGQGQDLFQQDSSSVFVEDCRLPERPELGEWHQKTVNNYALSLKNGESREEWWNRGAQDPKYAFRRALLSPHVFDSIVNIQCWAQQVPYGSSEHSHATFFILMYKCREPQGFEYIVTPVFRGASFTKAQGTAAVDINHHIVRVASLHRE